MKQKSLRQLARELGVSASYLSQVKNGKRPLSQKLNDSLNALGVKQSVKRFEMVPRVGLEPTRIAPADFKSAASANSATPARISVFYKL